MKVNKIIQTILILVAGITLLSCKKTLTREEYQSFITDPENGYRKTLELGDFEISAMYEPVDYIISREFENAKSEIIESRKNELNEFEHFQFRLKLIDGGNILRYNETLYQNESTRINHFSFEVAGDFILVSESDTAACKLALYSRNYNLTPTVDLTLSFQKMNHSENLKLIYSDNQFGIGKVKFSFDSEIITNTPELKLM